MSLSDNWHIERKSWRYFFIIWFYFFLNKKLQIFFYIFITKNVSKNSTRCFINLKYTLGTRPYFIGVRLSSQTTKRNWNDEKLNKSEALSKAKVRRKWQTETPTTSWKKADIMLKQACTMLKNWCILYLKIKDIEDLGS